MEYYDEIKKVKLNKMRLQRDYMLDIDEGIDFDVRIRHIGESVKMEFKKEIFYESIKEIKYPKDWREAFKERWFPDWLLNKYPVKYEVFEIQAFYPYISIPDEHSIVHVINKGVNINERMC